MNYNFDFDTSNSSTSSEPVIYDMVNSETSADDLNSIIIHGNEKLDRRRRIQVLKDVEFYSLAFELSLSQNKHAKKFFANEPGADEAHYEMKTNLFELNTFDHYTSNPIFLFGLNMFAKRNLNLTSTSTSIEQMQYEFEIFTSKHVVRSQPINLITNPLGINVTFTFNSIELRLNNNDDYLVQLTDRYFNLFFSSLLKAFGTFQLNFTSPLQLDPVGYHDNESRRSNSSFLIAACFSHLNLVTRKRVPEDAVSGVNYNLSSSYTYERFQLVRQTRSISYSQQFAQHAADYENDYGQQCDAAPARPRMMSDEAVAKRQKTPSDQQWSTTTGSHGNRGKCFLITKINSTTSQKINDYYDCKCNDTDSQTSCRSYYFWSSLSGRVEEEDDEYEEQAPSPLNANTCKNAGEYACFNNGTCVDDLDPSGDYTCLCQSFYTGKR